MEILCKTHQWVQILKEWLQSRIDVDLIDHVIKDTDCQRFVKKYLLNFN